MTSSTYYSILDHREYSRKRKGKHDLADYDVTHYVRHEGLNVLWDEPEPCYLFTIMRCTLCYRGCGCWALSQKKWSG